MIDEKKLLELINSKEFLIRFIRSSKSVQEVFLEFIEEQPKIGEWIPCEEGLPEEHDSIFAKLKDTDKWSNAMFKKTSNEVNATIEFEDGTRAVKTLHTIDGRWNKGKWGVKFKVIAWKPLPEAYHEP